MKSGSFDFAKVGRAMLILVESFSHPVESHCLRRGTSDGRNPRSASMLPGDPGAGVWN